MRTGNHLIRISVQSFLVFVLVVCAFGCANVVTPDGGLKDETPPKPISISPKNLSTNFKGREIKISFDEFFALNNAASEIYLSPIATGNLKYKIRRKQLIVSLPDSLKENTTYTLHFGNAIADVSEGNKLQGFNYVFSTGSVIDSLRIQGMVKDAMTQKPQKNFLVMLYSSSDDSVVAKSKPDYFTRTDENGQFVLDYLHEGKYRLFCLNDKNLNYIYDQSNEEIAFMDTIIEVNDTSDFFSLTSFLPEEKKTVLLSAATSDNKKIAFAFNHPIKNFKPEIISDSSEFLFQSTNRMSDTVFVWFRTKQADSVYLKYDLNEVEDNVGVRMKLSSLQKGGTTTNKFSLRTDLTGSKGKYFLSPEKKLEVYFNYPVRNIMKEFIPQIENDSTHEISHSLFVMKHDSLTGFPYSVLNYDFKPNIAYTISLPKNFFTDVFGNGSDSLILHFKKSETTETGNLALTINQKDTAHHYIAQLLLGTNVMKEWKLMSGKNIFTLTSITPSVYQLRFIRDDNENGKWDAGDYWKKLQPEKIIYNAKDIVLRANWDLEESAEISGETGKRSVK